MSRGRRQLVLAICCLSLLIVGMDSTIVNVALPAIRTSLGASVSGLQWVIDAYTLPLAAVVLTAGALADRFGRRKLFIVGLVIFSWPAPSTVTSPLAAFGLVIGSAMC